MPFLRHTTQIHLFAGYRYYTLRQCARLDLIHALKSCRLSLEEIRKIFSLSSTEELSAILKEQELKLEKEIYNLSSLCLC